MKKAKKGPKPKSVPPKIPMPPMGNMPPMAPPSTIDQFDRTGAQAVPGKPGFGR